MTTKSTNSVAVHSVVVVPATNQGCSQTTGLYRQGSVLPERFVSTSDPRDGIVRRELTSATTPLPKRA
jgi:hypothetical protein